MRRAIGLHLREELRFQTGGDDKRIVTAFLKECGHGGTVVGKPKFFAREDGLLYVYPAVHSRL